MSPEAIRSLVKPSAYQDSVTLLLLARQLRSGPGVVEAAALMATPSNQDLLEQSGLLTAEAAKAGPNDLVIAVRAESAAAAAEALRRARRFWAPSGSAWRTRAAPCRGRWRAPGAISPTRTSP